MRLMSRWCVVFACLNACGGSEPSDSDGGADTDLDGVADSSDALACDGITGEGYGEGDVSMDWTLNDMNGNPVSLYDYCGRVIYIEDTTAW